MMGIQGVGEKKTRDLEIGDEVVISGAVEENNVWVKI